jgi:predicted amidohydrolase YtcJ
MRKAFINGNIYTVNNKQPFTEAIIVDGNKIVSTGTNEEIREKINKDTETIDLKGKLMLPGFIDAHVHFMNGGNYLSGLNLRNAKSVSEFIETLKDYTKNIKDGWITGGSWDHEQWEEKILPNKEMIDHFTPELPVFIERMDKHIGLANSYALELADINENTPDPPGGEICKDQNGKLTGVLKDNAMSLIYRVIPEESSLQMHQDALTALEEAKKNGITSVHDITNRNDLSTYLQLERENKLTCRIYTILPINNYLELGDDINNGLNKSNKIKFRSLKAFADGSLGAETAWFFEPYENDTSTGLPQNILIDGNLKKLTVEADKQNLQVSTHAIGDKTNAYLLDIYAEIKRLNPVRDRRFRIEHAQHLRLQDIPRFSDIGVIASCQPYHLYFDGSYAEKKIGKERIRFSFPFKTLLDNNTILCFGSDWPVVPISPLHGIYAAVTRHTSDHKNPGGWIPEQKISVEDAVKCYTINNAFASFEENIKGSIEPGKLADLVVLNENIFKIPHEKIKDVKVDMTVFNGEIIYKRNSDY